MVGAELVGLSDAALAAADDHIGIPMRGLGTSLNVSVAVGVILLEAERQRLAAGFYERLRGSRPTSASARCSSGRIPRSRSAAVQLGRPYPPLKADGMAGVESAARRVGVDGQPAE